MNGASAAVCVAGVPFLGPFGAVRVGLDRRPAGREPDLRRASSESALDLVVAATEDSVMMVEAGAREVPEETLVEAIALGHQECRALVRAQRALAELAGKPRWEFDASAHQDPALEAQVREATRGRVREVVRIPEKVLRAQALTRSSPRRSSPRSTPTGSARRKVRE